MKIIKILFILLIILIVFLKLEIEFSAIEGDKNLKDVQKIKVGMDTSEVNLIMRNKPDTVIFLRKDPIVKRFAHRIWYDYEVPNSSSGYCRIFFDSSMHVIEVEYEY